MVGGGGGENPEGFMHDACSGNSEGKSDCVYMFETVLCAISAEKYSPICITPKEPAMKHDALEVFREKK